jgi:hypothetical protein
MSDGQQLAQLHHAQNEVVLARQLHLSGGFSDHLLKLKVPLAGWVYPREQVV